MKTSNVDPIQSELNELLSSEPTEISKFWRETLLLNLKQVARKILAVPATSSGPERHFSYAGKCANPERSTLSSEKVCSQTYACLALKNILLN